MPLIIGRSQQKHAFNLAHACRERGMNYKENPFKGSQDTTGKVLCTPSKVPLINDQSESKLHHLWQMQGECEVCSFRKIPRMEAEIHAKRYFFAK